MLDISKHEFLCMVGKLGPPVSTNFSAGPPPIFHGASNFFFMGPPSHFFGASNQKARGGRGLPGLPPEYALGSYTLCYNNCTNSHGLNTWRAERVPQVV